MMDVDEGPSRKRARIDDESKCIIHHTSGDADDKLVTPQSYDSWKSLCNAAKIRQHAPLLKIAETTKEQEIPSVLYHRKCRSLFTLKKSLDALSQKDMINPQNGTTGSPPYIKRGKSSNSPIYDVTCIFCQKKSRYLKRDHSREPLVQCCELRSDESIRNAALQKQDDRILALASRELVAAEAHYHRSCYREYTRKEKPSINMDQSETDLGSYYHNTECNAYPLLVDYMKREFIEKPHIMKFTEISDKLEEYMKEFGIDKIKDSTKKHIRRKLESKFGDSLQIFKDERGKLIVVPNTITVEQLAVENQKLKAELEIWEKSSSADDVINKASLLLRSHIKRIKPSITWPPKQSELTSDSVRLPETLQKFLQIILTGRLDAEPVSNKLQCIENTIGQDIIYNASGGKVHTPKHILLPYAVKSLTGNVELINILNRLGHGVSYSQTLEIDTALCLQKLSSSEDHCSILPGNIHPHCFTVLAWDNIDRLEETITGEGTSHRVNGIAVQSKSFGPYLPENKPIVEKKKQRSIEATPYVLPAYNSGQRIGPASIQTEPADYTDIRDQAWKKNLIWIIARLINQEDQTVSGWTGFNISVRDGVVVVEDRVGYLPTINSPATNMATVQEILMQSLNVMKKLSLAKIVVVFDQALYAKASEIVWKHNETYQNVILRLGVFHTICTLLSTIGKRFKDAGLKDLCIEADIITEGSTAGVLEGRQYNRCIRVHKILYEAFLRLAWTSFLTWVEAQQDNAQDMISSGLLAITDLQDNISQEQFDRVLKDCAFAKLFETFSTYLDFLRKENGHLSRFWMSYVDMVEILLSLLRSSREGNWSLHLSSIRDLIPWCFAYDKQNYARYLSVYLAQMTNLQEDHPDVYEHFKAGQFSVQLGSKNPFSRIPVDQTLEETVNRDTQTAGGTKGFSLNPGAVTRYYLTAEFRSIFLRQLRDMANLGPSGFTHKDLNKPRIARDESDVSKVVRLLENDWLNPFSNENSDLVSLSTATVATPDILADLDKAHEVGEISYRNFKVERLESSSPAKKFHDRLTRNNLKTFSDINGKKKTVKAGNVNVVLRADRNLFARMVIMAESRQLDMQEVLAHPLGPLPWSLATSDGSLRKTTKSTLAKELQKGVPPAESIPQPSACVIDGMSIVQKLKGDHRTFSDIAASALCYVLNEGRDSKRIDVVFDTYKEKSIKNAERNSRRCDIDGIQYKNIAPGHKVQQWRKFLTNSTNKTNLIKFLITEWKQAKQRKKLNGKVLYVTCEEECYQLTADSSGHELDLHSSHEEADTRLLLHANHASKSGYPSIVIISEDTDVFILSLFASFQIKSHIYQKCGTQARTRFVDVSKVASDLGDDVCLSLTGMHAFTGCDTISSFAGRGKVAALKLLKSEEKFQKMFKQLGSEWEIHTDLFDCIQQFTCLMYGCPRDVVHSNVNKFRYQLFCTKKGELESHQLPPCIDSLMKHTIRSNYQASIWRRCLEPRPKIPDPCGHGWVLESEQLVIDWMDGPPAPVAVLQLLSCKCTRSCKEPNCVCLANKLKCTTMCKLQGCSNQKCESNDEQQDFNNQQQQNDDVDDEDRF